MTKEALKLALEALTPDPYRPEWAVALDIDKAITAIEEALAQPEQEPVATINDLSNSKMFTLEANGYSRKDNLYTTPPKEQQSCDKREWVGLTDDEIQQCYKAAYKVVQGRRLETTFARALETYLREKNT